MTTLRIICGGRGVGKTTHILKTLKKFNRKKVKTLVINGKEKVYSKYKQPDPEFMKEKAKKYDVRQAHAVTGKDLMDIISKFHDGHLIIEDYGVYNRDNFYPKALRIFERNNIHVTLVCQDIKILSSPRISPYVDHIILMENGVTPRMGKGLFGNRLWVAQDIVNELAASNRDYKYLLYLSQDHCINFMDKDKR